jgi:hypothetical protein
VLSLSGAAMRTFCKYLIVFWLTVVLLSLPLAASAADPVQAAVQWLHAQQLPDGGFGLNGKSTAAVTADVVYVLALAGEDPGGSTWAKAGGTALDALARLAPGYIGTDAGQAGKVARAVAAAGRNPRSFGGMDVIAVIEAAYNPATGRYHPGYLFRHTLAVEALQRSNVNVPAQAYAALRQAQLPGGGWSWSFPVVGKPLPPPDVDTTGRVLQVLGRAPLSQCDATLEPGAQYLASAQLETGGWADAAAPTTKPANANSTGLAVGGLRATGRDPDAAPFVKGGHSALQALLAFQEQSGAFGYTAVPGGEEYRLTATTDAVAGLLQALGQTGGECRRVYLPMVLAR